MAITITKTPAAFSYAFNPIEVEFSNGLTVANSSIVIDATAGLPTWGTSIDFYVNSELISFVYIYTTFNDFYNDLNQNFILKQYFIITKVGNVITLTAYDNDDLNINVITSPAFAPTTVTVTNATDLEKSVFLAVVIWNGTIYVPSSFDKSHKFLKDGKAYFNIAEAFAFQELEIPENALTAFVPFLTVTLNYKLQYGSETEGVSITSELFAINGQFNADYLGNEIDSNVFLTASPRTIFSKDDEPRFLSFIALDDCIDIELIINAIDADDNTVQIVKTIADLQKGELVNIPISYFALDLDAHANAPFVEYNLQLHYETQSTQFTTEVFTIECNRQVDLNYSTFLFLNSRGGIDTISFTGETEETTTFTGLSYQKTNPTGSNQNKSEQHKIRYTFKQYSGFFDDWQQFNYIEELLNSKEVFWLKDTELKRIVIERSDFKKGSQNDDIYSAEFEFVLDTDAIAADLSNAPTSAGTAVTLPPVTITYPISIDYAPDPEL